MPECKSKGMACRRSDKLSNITPESSERSPVIKGSRILLLFLILLCFVGVCSVSE